MGLLEETLTHRRLFFSLLSKIYCLISLPPSDLGLVQHMVMLFPLTWVASGVPGASGTAVEESRIVMSNHRGVAHNTLLFHMALGLLTVLHLGNDRIRVERFPHSKLIHSRDSELVLVALDKVGGIVGAGFTFRRDQCPGDPGRLPLFHHVVGNSRAAVIFRRVPPHCALLSCDACKTDWPLNRSWSIWKEVEGRK